MFPALTARTAYELFYTRLGQRALSVANFWYDPRHRDLYLKYSVYLAVIDNVKQQESSSLDLQQTEYDNNFKRMMVNKSTAVNSSTTTVAEINDDTPKIIEARVAAAIAAVSAATVKIAESHSDKNSDANNVTTDVDTLMAKVSVNDNYCAENGNDNSNPNIKKLGLTRLQRLVLIGGPDDGVISPWQSRYLLFTLYCLFRFQNEIGIGSHLLCMGMALFRGTTWRAVADKKHSLTQPFLNFYKHEPNILNFNFW